MFENLNHDIKIGGFVKTKKHNFSGRVTGFQHGSSQDPEWIAVQEPPLTDEEINGRFVSILCDTGGAITVPDSDCTPIAPIDEFTHLYQEFYFGPDDTRPVTDISTPLNSVLLSLYDILGIDTPNIPPGTLKLAEGLISPLKAQMLVGTKC